MFAIVSSLSALRAASPAKLAVAEVLQTIVAGGEATNVDGASGFLIRNTSSTQLRNPVMRRARTRAENWRVVTRITVLTGLLLMVTACAAIRGGPKSFLDVKSKPVENKAMTALLAATDRSTRNTNITTAMADVDAFYVPYRDRLLQGDNQFNASVDLLALLSDIAGRAAESTAAKDNYLSFGALMTGTRSTINNRFFYAQTGIALVKGMDAARTERALAIKRRLSLPIEEYTGHDAYSDVLKYYFDGTLAGGLIWLQSNASQNEIDNQAKIASLKVPTDAELKARETLSNDVGQRLGNEAAMRRALDFWKIPNPGKDTDAVRAAFLGHFQLLFDNGLSETAVRDQLNQAGFFKD